MSSYFNSTFYLVTSGLDRLEQNIMDHLQHIPPEFHFKFQIEAFIKHVCRGCRDRESLQKAKDLVPISSILQNNPQISGENYQDMLLPQLLHWFSNQFFSWSIPINCESCHTDLGLERPLTNPDGSIVEIYKCKNVNCTYSYQCGRNSNFSSLLHNRKGRSEEWAICFMLFLRAFEYEARIVMDTTDNFWNEVWSEPQLRWIHVDPYENIIDQPLLYELHWNKKLEYCLAFSQHEILDVTRRYSAHYDSTSKLRRSCEENWIEPYLDRLTSKILINQSQIRRDGILKRRFLDKASLVSIPTHVLRSLPQGTIIHDPKIGTLGWRIQPKRYSRINKKSFVIEVKDCYDPLDKTNRGSLFELSYNSLKDSYSSSLPAYKLQGWSSLTFFSENLDYKYERDWKTSYVSRYDSCSHKLVGKLQWRFNMAQTNNWTNISIKLDCMIYPKTTIELRLDSYDHMTPGSGGFGAQESIYLKPNTVNTISRSQVVRNTVMIDLVAELAGGKKGDEHSWQKPQLFRQTRGEDDDEWTFEVKVY